MDTLRCSDLDMADKCPQSVFNLDNLPRVSRTYPETNIGKAAHKMLQDFGDGKGVNPSPMLSNAENEEAFDLVEYGQRVWSKISSFFASPQTERPLEADFGTFRLTGTVDVLSPMPNMNDTVFIDWKSGRLDTTYHQQMHGYAAILHRLDSDAGNNDSEVTAVVVFLRHKYYRVIKFKASESVSWVRDFERNVLNNKARYSVGSHCSYCDLYASCPARKERTKSAIDDIMDPDHAGDIVAQFDSINEGNKNTPEVGEFISDVLWKSKMLQHALDDTKEGLRCLVDRVGPIPVSDTTALGIRDVQRSNIDAKAAYPILSTKISTEDLMGAAKLSTRTIQHDYAKIFPIHLRAEKSKEILDILENAGALQYKTINRMELIDTSKPTKGKPDAG